MQKWFIHLREDHELLSGTNNLVLKRKVLPPLWHDGTYCNIYYKHTVSHSKPLSHRLTQWVTTLAKYFTSWKPTKLPKWNAISIETSLFSIPWFQSSRNVLFIVALPHSLSVKEMMWAQTVFALAHTRTHTHTHTQLTQIERILTLPWWPTDVIRATEARFPSHSLT